MPDFFYIGRKSLVCETGQLQYTPASTTASTSWIDSLMARQSTRPEPIETVHLKAAEHSLLLPISEQADGTLWLA